MCQTEEPQSLYLYAAGGPARAGIFAALFDGPIESVGYDYQPVLVDALPSVSAGTAGIEPVVVSPGERVVDAVTGAVVPLGEGVHLRQLDGSAIAYAGSEAAATVRTWAQFALRSGVHWADGQPLTADDSIFSFEIASSPDTPASKFAVDRTARYESIENRAVRWTGLPGWVDSQYYLRFWTPLPRHRYGAHSAAGLLSLPEANESPLGWGAFMPAPGGWVRGSRLTLVRNPAYFRAGEGLPRVDRITFRFGLDAAAIVGELAAGRCDLAPSSVDLIGVLDALRQAESAGSLTLQVVPETVFEHLDVGLAPVEDYKRAAGIESLQDARVRQAIAVCIDRQALVDELLGGLAEVATSYVPAGHPFYAGEALARYDFDPARGQALLDDAGWPDADGDGVREQGGRRLALDLVSGPAGSPFREALVEFIRAQLAANCSIEVRPSLLPAEDLYSPWPAGPLFGRRFDLATFPWRAGLEPPCDLYLTESIPSDQNPGGSNDTGYSSPAFDDACRAAQQSLDPGVRRERHAAAQVTFSQDLPSLPLFFRPRIGAAGPRLRGYQLDPTGGDLWNVEALEFGGL